MTQQLYYLPLRRRIPFFFRIYKPLIKHTWTLWRKEGWSPWHTVKKLWHMTDPNSDVYQWAMMELARQGRLPKTDDEERATGKITGEA